MQFPKHMIFAFLGICFASVILYPDSVSWDPSAVLQGQFKIWFGLSAVFATVILTAFSTSSEKCRVCLVVTSKLFRDWVWLQFFCSKASSYSMLSHNMAWSMSFLALPLYSVANWTSPEEWHFKGNPWSVPLPFSQRCRKVTRVGKSTKILWCTLSSVILEKKKKKHILGVTGDLPLFVFHYDF